MWFEKLPTEIRNLTRRHGRMLVAEDSDFFHCCMKCEVATALGSVEACPQRVHTSNSCCPSCDLFLEHGSEAMLAHWEDAQFLVAFQVVIPLKISEEVIRSAFGLHKVPANQLRLFYEWKRNARTLDVAFEKHIEWSMTLQQTYWDLDLEDPFLRDSLIFGLAGFPDRAGAAAFSQLRQVVEDFKTWARVVHQIDPNELYQDDLDSINHQSFASYFISYFLRFENADNLTINILAPDYEHSRDPESCLVIVGDKQIPLVSFQNINEVLAMQKGLLTSWHRIEPALQSMLEELAEITADMRTTQVDSTVPYLSELLDRIQTIQEQFLKLKPTISNMQGQIPVSQLSDPLIKKLLPYFNLALINSWLDFTKSVERSVDGANAYIGGKMDLLALNQERRTTKRINLLTALFGILSGMNLLMAYLTWATPDPTQGALLFTALLTMSLIGVSVAIAVRVIWKE